MPRPRKSGRLAGARIAVALLVVVVLVPASLLALYNPGQTQQHDFSNTKRIVIKLKAEVEVALSKDRDNNTLTGVSAFDNISRRHGIVQVESLRKQQGPALSSEVLRNVLIVTASDKLQLDELATAYEELDIVEYAHPDWPAELYVAPDDPLYEQQWSLNNTGQGCYHVIRLPGSGDDTLGIVNGTPDADIDQLEVFENPPDATTTVVVAMIDTGVDLDHPDLAAHIWTNPGEIPGNGIDDDHNGYIDDYNGWDFCGNVLQFPLVPDNNPTDGYGHGTHCAGTITAVGNNSLGVSGIVDDCKIMALKFYPVMLSSYASEAIIYAADNGADVISMSWGYPWPVQILEDALAYARQRGVVLVAAAGNDFVELYNYPAAYDGVITVSASTRDDLLAEFSTFGTHVEVCAPGYGILSLRADAYDMYGPSEAGVHIIDNNYYLASGTSMACPHVAGVAAYLRAVSPGLTPDATQAILQTTADDIVDPYGIGWDYPGWDKWTGSGRVNLQAALAAAPALRVRITSPHPRDLVNGVVTVEGIADGADFTSYTLEYGVGGEPTSWTAIQTSSTPVTNGVLGEWNTSGLEGLYSLRLRAGSAHLAALTLFITNTPLLAITSPANGGTVISSTVISGSASCPDFLRSEIHYGAGASPGSWTKIATLTSPVINQPLTEWSAAALSDGVYSLRLSLYDGSGLVGTDMVTVDVQSPFSGSHGWSYHIGTKLTITPNYGDFDNDGSYEIAIGTESGLVWLNPNGTVKTGMPSTPADDFRIPIAVGDLDDDEIDDWVAVGTGSGSFLYGFPSSAPNFVVAVPPPHIDGNDTEYDLMPYVFLYDVDGDGHDEIHYTQGYYSEFDGYDRYRVFNADGTDRVVVPLLSESPYPYLPADLDNDGTAELYQALQHLYQYDLDGNLVETVSFPNAVVGSFDALSLSAAELGDDGTLTLIVHGKSRDENGECWTLLYDKDLQLLPDGVHNNKIDSYLDPSPPVWGDIDGDGSLEYFMTLYELSQSSVYSYRMDGSPYTGDTLLAYYAGPANPAILLGGVIADVNGDRLADVVVCAHPDIFLTYPLERLVAWDLNGEQLDGWPLVTVPNAAGQERAGMFHPVIGDLDRNGTTDVICCSLTGEVLFTTLNGVGYYPPAMFAPMFRYNRRLDNIYRSPEMPDYICGDANFDGLANITDAVFLINYIFSGGPTPWPLAAGDVSCDGLVNITDAVYLIQYIFSGGNPPCDTDGDEIPDC